MKKMFAPAWLTAWLAGVLPDRLFWVGKKTPWYRQGLMQFAPWVGAALMAPFAVFLAWKGFKALTASGGQAASQ